MLGAVLIPDFVSSPAFFALLSTLVALLAVASTFGLGLAQLIYANRRAVAEGDRSERAWSRATAADQVAALESFAETCLRSMIQFQDWTDTQNWSQSASGDEVLDVLMGRLKSASAASDLDPSGALIAAVETLHELLLRMQVAFQAQDSVEVNRLYNEEMTIAANTVTASLAAAKAR